MIENRWRQQAAQTAIDRWGPTYGKYLALRLYTARLIGSDPALVLHGGGNVSLKHSHQNILGEEVEAIFVKGSGWNLAELEPAGLPILDLTYLRRLLRLNDLGDQQMTNELRTHLFDASAPNPSIETLVHAGITDKYVDHSHSDAVLTLTNQPNGERVVREALGDRIAILPYVYPGFKLAKAMIQTLQTQPHVEGVVLIQHGLFTFGPDAETSYRRHIELVQACETFIERKTSSRSLSISSPWTESPQVLAAVAAPILRGLITSKTSDENHPYRPPLLEWRAAPPILRLVNSEEVKVLASTGPVTTDHLIRTGRVPLYVEDPAWHDRATLRCQLEQAVEAFRTDYSRYLTEQLDANESNCLTNPEVKQRQDAARAADTSPRVVLLPGAGILAFGPTKADARIAADITEQTLQVKCNAQLVGGFTALSEAHLFEMEFRGLQLYKLNQRTTKPLEHQVVVISGGAGAIGSAIAQVCARAAAHVVVTDLEQDRLDQVVKQIEAECGPGTATGVVMNVTDEASVRSGFKEICRIYGGLDVLVPNAGIGHVGLLENLELADLRHVMEVNLVGYHLFMREGVKVLKNQGIGGHIVINASKNVFGPGKEFGAYSVSKAAGHQLGKVGAIELAPHGIRVNMINADAVFDNDQISSGLWNTVGPQRAQSRNMKTEELPEFYRNRNLLKSRIRGYHVGNAVVFFASNQTPTTGATLPVDGGVVEAFPR